MPRRISRQEFLRIGGASFAGAALLGGAASCGGGGSSGPVTLTWWDYWTEGATLTAIENLLERYAEANPDVTVDRRSIPFDQLKPALLRASAAGELPDIAVIDNPDMASFAAQGVLLDVTERAEEWGQGAAYFEGPWRSCQYEGVSYGLPNSTNCLALFYNTDMLEEAGIEPPTTWEELREAAAELTTGDRRGLAVSAIKSEEGTFQWLPFLWQSGEDLPTIASEGGQAALSLWVEMVRDGSMARGILGWRQEDVKNEFQNRRAAMMVNGPWQIPVLEQDSPDLNWAVVELPRGEESASILGGENVGITSGSQNPDAAWDLLTWIQNPDNLLPYLEEVDRLPGREDLAERPVFAEDPVLSIFVEQLKVARPRAYGPNYPEISTAVQVALQGAISGESGVREALERAQSQITPLLEGEGT
jgi:multiple sugar transport system substrate-binding protein